MHDFIMRLIRHNPEKYGADGVHSYQNSKMFVSFLVHGGGKEFDVLEFKKLLRF
jgi:hypothetical protein